MTPNAGYTLSIIIMIVVAINVISWRITDAKNEILKELRKANREYENG